MTTRASLLACLLAACAGGDSDPANDAGTDLPDGGPGLIDATDASADTGADASIDAAGDPDAAPTPTCAWLPAPVGVIDTYPGEFEGDLEGASDVLQPTSGACAAEDLYQNQPLTAGEEVVALTGLVPGTTYRIGLKAFDYAAFYVITGCGGISPFDAGDCALLINGQMNSWIFHERGEFVATADHAWVVIDSSPTIATFHEYVLWVLPDDRCVSHFDCTDPGAPYCAGDPLFQCAINLSTCDDDDGGEDDNGPHAAQLLSLVPGVTTTVDRSMCAGDPDWYRFTVPDGASARLTITPIVEPFEDVSAGHFDPAGHFVGWSGGTAQERVFDDLPPGTHYILVGRGGLDNDTLAYRVTLATL